MFANLSLKLRMVGIGVISLLGLLVVALWSALAQRSSMYEEREIMLKSLVEAGHSQVKHYEDLANRGQLTREEAQAGAREALRALRFQGDNYLFIYTHEGITILLPPAPDKEGQSRIDVKDPNGVPLIRDMVAKAKAGGGFTAYAYPRPGQTEVAPKFAYSADVPGWQWIVGAGLYVDDIQTAFRKQLIVSGIVILFLSLGVFGAVMLIARSVLRQLGGEPRDAMALMQQVSAGDLTVSLRSAQPGSLLGDLDGLIHHLRELIGNIHQGAEHISSASQDIRAVSTSVAEAATTQAASTQGMAASMEELTVSVTQISDNASDTDQYTRGAAQDAAQGVQQANATVDAMNALIAAIGEAVGQINGLSQRTQEVGSIAAIIKEIADQTNLLALNAAIEAARAGETGRGFAVVADEVRKLAERTTQATSDIERTLASIQSDTQGAVGAMHHASTQANRSAGEVGQTSSVLQRIAQGATQAQHLVADVADAAREQRTASTALAQQVEQIAQAADQTSHRMEETSHAAAGLEQVARELQNAVRRFRV